MFAEFEFEGLLFATEAAVSLSIFFTMSLILPTTSKMSMQSVLDSNKKEVILLIKISNLLYRDYPPGSE